MKENSYLVWTQLADPLAPDVISLNGTFTDEANHDVREQLVSWASEIAESPDRRDFDNGGFVALSGRSGMAEIVVSSRQPDFQPVIAIGVRLADDDSGQPSVDEVVAEVLRVAGTVEYYVVPEQVTSVVQMLTRASSPAQGSPHVELGSVAGESVWGRLVRVMTGLGYRLVRVMTGLWYRLLRTLKMERRR